MAIVVHDFPTHQTWAMNTLDSKDGGAHLRINGQRRRRRDVVLFSGILILFLLLFRLVEQLHQRDETLLSFVQNMCNNGIRQWHAAQRRAKRDEYKYLTWLEAIRESATQADAEGTSADTTRIEEDNEKIVITMNISNLPEGMRLKDIQLSISDGETLIKQIYSRRPIDEISSRRGTAKTATATIRLKYMLDQKIESESNNDGVDRDELNIRDVEATMNKDGELEIVAWKDVDIKAEAVTEEL